MMMMWAGGRKTKYTLGLSNTENLIQGSDEQVTEQRSQMQEEDSTQRKVIAENHHHS